jgi:uncharacterized protein YcnI
MSATRPRPTPRPTPPVRPMHGDRSSRTSTWRVARRAGALAVTGALALAAPAAAHPFVRGGELPVDSLATMTLAMAHGCGSEASGEGDPTTDVSMEIPDWLRVVEVADLDGWAVEFEEDDDGVPEVVTWTAEGAEEPAPDFDLDVVASGEVGDERYLRVFQACDEFVYRWVGTPDEPADDPAIRVTLTEPDPDAPPPPEPEPEPADEPEPVDEPEATEEPDATDEPDEDDGPAGDAEADSDPEPLAADRDDGGLPGWLVPVTVVVLLGALGALLFARRSRSET